MSNDTQEPKMAGGGHERRDVRFKPLVIAAVALVTALIVAVIGMERLFVYLSARQAARSEPASPLVASRREAPPEPRLQTEPLKDLQQLRDHEEAVLGSYGWVDRAAGVVRIPIERAMEITLERAPKTPALRDQAEQ
jgi:hypothetical protein